MNTNDLNMALYEKMAAEQDKYRDWLKSQPPEEILHHTYEYTIREDIVMAIRVSMSTTFDGVVTPLKIDISTGDAITPREVRYSFKLMLEDRSIDIWAYNLETVLAEKLETIITRTTTNTRMRDFYDIYILEQLHGTTLNPKILHDALLATAHKRGSEKYLNQAEEVFDEVENDSVMQKLWEAYRKKFSYASDLEWDVIMKVIRRLYVLCEKGISL